MIMSEKEEQVDPEATDVIDLTLARPVETAESTSEIATTSPKETPASSNEILKEAKGAEEFTTTTEPSIIPSRPPSATEKLIKELQDVFPNIEQKYINMCLIASEGQIESASNALLYLSDPTCGVKIPDPVEIPLLPTRPSAKAETINKVKQMESDEALARRLSRAYERGSKKAASKPQEPQQRKKLTRSMSRTSDDDFEDYNDEEEDLYESVSKNVTDARNMVGGWLGNFAKKIQGEPESFQSQQQQKQQKQPIQYQQAPKLPARKSSGQLFSAFGNSNAPKNPALSEQFNGIQLSEEIDDSDELYSSKKKNSLEKSRQGLEKKTEKLSPSTDEKKKWQPLESVAPEPLSNDTFMVDDSDEDDESAKK